MTRPRPLVVVATAIGLLAPVVRAQPYAPSPQVILGGAPGHRGEAVRAWMTSRLGAFGLVDGVDGLRVANEEALPAGGARVLVQQLWHGLPVVGADARAIVGADGRLTSLISGFEHDLDAPLEPGIVAAVAGARAARAAGMGSMPPPGSTTLVVERRADGDHLEWEVSGHRADGEPVRTRVDAVSGDVLDVDAGVAHAVGRVFLVDPRQPLTEVELPGLLAGSPLRSSSFGIDDALTQPVQPVAPGDYRLVPSDPGFDQVNLYWHVAHDFQDFYGPLGYAGPPESLVVRMHFALDPEVARTSGNVVTFGNPIPGFCLEPTRASDIVYHELGHAVLYGFGVLPGGLTREASALHEGLADYFSAAFTGDPVIGEWAYVTFPNGVTRLDQPAPPWDMAHYDQVAFGGGGLSSPWANGMILSSALWDLRRQIDRSCDSLVLESLAYLPSIPTWAQFVNALFYADRDHHGSRYWRTIGDALRRRGIRSEVTATIDGPTDLAPAQSAAFHALDCCSGTPGSYHWRARDWCRGVPCGPWRDLGDADSVRTSFLGDGQLQLGVSSQFGDTATALVFVRVSTPSLAFTGPTQLPKGATGTWRVRLVAASQWGLSVYRQWRVAGKPQELLGHLTAYTFAASDPFQLTATLTDGLGRQVAAQLDVGTFTDRPPASGREMVQLAQSLVGGRSAETRVELAQATALRLAVYDIRGRERTLLADDDESRGERVIRWDAAVLEPGIYFLRATTAIGHTATLRFVVVR